MSWLNLNQSLNSLKGQITNFATEVLADGAAQITTDGDPSVAESSLKDLEVKYHNQELEIAELKKLTEELQTTLQSERLVRKNGVKESEEESTWYWDPTPQSSKPINDDIQEAYKTQIQVLQDEISILKERENVATRDENEEELNRLREENKNLTCSLDDLDNQHQMAMERLLTLKKELQKNFEVLKQEHEELKSTNNEYELEKKNLLKNIEDRNQELERIKSVHPDYDTLYHKYQNLERVHSILRENAEKFQEENQELHEEVFKLQEQVTKLEHDLEVAGRNFDDTKVVTVQKYEEVLKQLNNYKQRRDSNQMHLDEINIDDNAKGVIETLKRDISTLKLRLAQYEDENYDSDNRVIKSDKIIQLYNRYINFDLPVDYVGEMPSSTDNVVMFKIETVFKTVNSFKKDLEVLQHQLSEKKLNINHLQTQIDELSSENEYLTADMQHLDAELEEMKKNNDFLISEIAMLKNSSKLEPIIETHEDNIVKLETELADCNKINKTFESEIKKIEQELTIVNNEKKMLQNSLNDLRNQYMSMITELEMCKRDTKALQELENQSHLQQTTSNTCDNENLKRRLSFANAEKEKLSIDNHIIENEKVLLTKEVDDLRNALQVTSNSQKELESMKIILDQKLQELEIKLDDVLKDKEDLEKENIKLKENIKVKDSSTLKIVTEKLAVQNCNLLSEDNSHLKKEPENMTEDIIIPKPQFLVQSKSVTNLQELHDVVKLKSDQLDATNKELLLLKESNRIIFEEKLQFEELDALKNAKILYLENESGKLISDLNDKITEIEKLNNFLSESELNNSNLSKMVSTLQDNIKFKDVEKSQLEEKNINVSKELQENSSIIDNIREELKKLYTDKEEISKQFQALVDEVSVKNSEISRLTVKVQELDKCCSDFKTTIKDKDNELKQVNLELERRLECFVKSDQQNDVCSKLNEEKYAIELALNNLRQELQQKENDLAENQNRIYILENESKEVKKALEDVISEKTELINLVNLKHNESIQYHTEIQRLNHVLLEQTNDFKRIVEEKDSTSLKHLEKCANCEALHNSLKQKEELIISLNQNISENEKLKPELVNASGTVKNLTRRCEDLDKNLTIQLDIVKKVTAENLQLSEREQNSTRELERLRHHLVELEESYTQELMTSEQKLNESQNRLHQVEERAKQTSTVYTSNSIRANQEVETLRNQIKLLEKQRDDVQTRLSDAEDTRSRSEAALTNLQIVLEQFQLDKERDISAATEKIRWKLEEEKQQNINLREEIVRLNKKLEESKAGLQAATRLGDKVEIKTAQINDLKEQVRTLHISVTAAEDRYHNAISNQQDKVDKNLVKNLVVNYVMSGQNILNKTQVLRVLSTVLDFNQQECEKLGLIKPAVGESLAAEFVRFLQDESKPRPPQPSLMRLQTRAPSDSSRKTSTSSQQPVFEVGHSRNPSTGSHNLLFQSIDGAETASQRSAEASARVVTGALAAGVTQTRNNEGAILKNVLKDL